MRQNFIQITIFFFVFIFFFFDLVGFFSLLFNLTAYLAVSSHGNESYATSVKFAHAQFAPMLKLILIFFSSAQYPKIHQFRNKCAFREKVDIYLYLVEITGPNTCLISIKRTTISFFIIYSLYRIDRFDRVLKIKCSFVCVHKHLFRLARSRQVKWMKPATFTRDRI